MPRCDCPACTPRVATDVMVGVSWDDLRPGDVLSWDCGDVDAMRSPIMLGERLQAFGLDRFEVAAGVSEYGADLAGFGYIYTTDDHADANPTVTRPTRRRSWFDAWPEAPMSRNVIPDGPMSRSPIPEPPQPRSHANITEADQDRAYELRLEGLTWNQVADRMRWPRTTEGRYSLARWAAFKARKRRGLVTPRTPSTELVNRRFGIEIEFNSSLYRVRDQVVTAARVAGLAAQVESYNHAVRRHWKMTDDSTVTGGEFVSPPLYTDVGLTQTRIALRAILDNEGETGRNCGMHVHHDVTDFTATQVRHLVKVARMWERPLMAYVPKHRWDGSNGCGAALIRRYEWEDMEEMTISPRSGSRDSRRNSSIEPYRSINFDAVLWQGTLEFRGLGHTLNADKVDTWVRVTQAIVEYARLGLPLLERQTTRHMLDHLVANNLITDETRQAFLTVATADRQADIRNAEAA